MDSAQAKFRTKAMALSELNVPAVEVQSHPSSAGPVDVNSAAYISELRKLLVKSKGTSYEGTLQKFIDIKNREILESSGNRSPPRARATPANSVAPQSAQNSVMMGASSVQYPFTPRLRGGSPDRFESSQDIGHYPPSPFRLDISGLDSTQFVDHHEKLRCTIHSNDRKRWIDVMAQPLERNLWRGAATEMPTFTNNGSQLAFGGVPRVATNHLGRQRPPSWQPTDDLRSVDNFPRRGLDGTRVPPSTTFIDNRNSGSTVSVSLSEFDEWLQRNKDWKAGVMAKIQHKTQQRDESDKLHAKPRIIEKSEKLAVQANRKILEASVSLQDIVGKTELGTSRKVQEENPALSASLASVFDRLHIRAKLREDSPGRGRSPAPLPQDIFVFEPHISKRSEKLVLNRRRRALSAGSRREKDIGIIHSIEYHKQSIDEIRRSSKVQQVDSDKINSKTSFTNSTDAALLKAGAMLEAELEVSSDNAERRKHSIRSVNSASSVDQASLNRGRSPSRNFQSPGRNQDGSPSRSYRALRSHSYDSIRGRGASPGTKKVKQWVLKEEKSHADSKPFHPVLLATETKKIMSRQHEDFTERMNKSVENFHVRKAVAERAYEPGPMHYISVPNQLSASSSPLRGPAHRPSSGPVGGRNGFTWSKQTREASLGVASWKMLEQSEALSRGESHGLNKSNSGNRSRSGSTSAVASRSNENGIGREHSGLSQSGSIRD